MQMADDPPTDPAPGFAERVDAGESLALGTWPPVKFFFCSNQGGTLGQENPIAVLM
jgi:hypothetical protein